MPSIRARLHRRLAWLIAAVWAPASLLIVAAVALEYNESFHSRTAHTAQLMLAFASTQPASPTVFPLLTPQRSSDFEVDLHDYLIVISRNGQLLYASEPLPAEQLLALPVKGTVDIHGDSVTIDNFEDERTGTRVAIGVDTYEPFFSSLQVAGLVAGYVLIAAALIRFAMTVGIRSGLKPLGAFADQVRDRSEENLAPLDEAEAPSELRGVAHALNGLMARLQLVLEHERDFVSNAAHELRTPLTAIRAQVEALEGDVPERIQPRFANILEATNRAGRLVAQLLDVARSQSIDLTRSPGSRIDLIELVQSVIADLVPSANERDVEVTLDSPRSAAVTAYPELLAIVLRNLVENAVKYAASPGRVIVTVARVQPASVDLLVEDDGPGLSAEAFERAFERFQRLGRSGGNGVGLGLSIVAELCRRMNVPVDRLEPGALGGLHVRLRLPSAPPPVLPDHRTSY
ncbi:HAMP domain-containing sensor histidine kinase [Inquilinus sp. Marseille-Q2685]|uniref:sensor histidine kinase n=1 Tax=Inquilinus sp. Marseille-Q2685 TaxID=2866581 RepID=UPI001CE3F80A|nr:ATP-binding protein [Inquilinus sp. Marseille-Q2685]